MNYQPYPTQTNQTRARSSESDLPIWWRGVCINSENHLDQSDVILHTERVKLL